MKVKFLVPAVVFMALSLIVIIGNTVYVIKGEWGLWTIYHWGAVIFHAITMVIALFLFSNAIKKDEEE